MKDLSSRPLAIFSLAILSLAIFLAPAVAPAQATADLSQRIQALEQSATQNRQRLLRYKWTESTQVTVKGNRQPPSQWLCQFGPDGNLQKTPLSTVVDKTPDKKQAAMEDYVEQVRGLLAEYVPPSPDRMQQAFQAGNVSLNAVGGAATADIIFKDFAQPGDQMTVTFNTQTRRIAAAVVNTYLNDPKEVVKLNLQFGTLADGTNAIQITALNMVAKKVQIVTTSSNFEKLPRNSQ
jgi:hypothetical protein